jgi:diacylglycerol kinase family enzyme
MFAMATSLRPDQGEATGFSPKRLGLVLNEKAGALLADPSAAETLRADLRAAGIDVTEPLQGALPERVAAAARSADTVVVAGGDGTVACAAGALAGTGVALGMLPCGTMNLLAKDLGLPAGDLAAAGRALLTGRPRDIDVGTVAGQMFLCACMIGAPARMGRHREKARRRGWFWQWPRLARAAIFVLRRPRPRRLVLIVDGRAHALRTASLTITLGALDDATGHLFGRSRLDGGVLCAYVVRRRSPLHLLRVAWRLARGQEKDRALSVFSGTDMEVRSAAPMLHVMVDGEVQVLPAPVAFGIRPGALTVIAP